MPIDRLDTVCIFVSDQNRANNFYTEVLGFELRADAPLFPGATARWIEVAPKNSATVVILYLPDENWQHYKQVVGKSQAVTFRVTDMASLHKDLKAKGVNICPGTGCPTLGTYATILDSEGNSLILVEHPKSD